MCFYCRWFEGAHPWGVGNNQGIEGTNKSIKASHTFKRRAPIGAFMDIVARMVKEWSEKDDSLLHGARMSFLEHDPSGLRLKTEGSVFINAFVGGIKFIICFHIVHNQFCDTDCIAKFIKCIYSKLSFTFLKPNFFLYILCYCKWLIMFHTLKIFCNTNCLD